MADNDVNSATAIAEQKKKLETFSLAHRELIGKAVIDGLISPDVVASTGGGGNYAQDGGGYTQSGGGNHFQGGNGDYNQSKMIMQTAFDPAELVSKLVDAQVKTATALKTQGLATGG